MRFKSSGTAVFAMIFMATAVDAQCDTSACSKVLVQDIFSYESQTHVALAFLSLLDSTTYDQAKTKLNTAGQIVYAGIPMGGNLDFSQFKSHLSKQLQKNKIDYTRDEATSLLTAKLSPTAITAWSECIKTVCGVEVSSIEVRQIDDTGVMFAIKWVPPAGVTEPLKYTLKKATVPTDPAQISGQAAVQVSEEEIYPRDPSSDLKVKVSLEWGGVARGSRIFTIAKNPPPPPVYTPSCSNTYSGAVKSSPNPEKFLEVKCTNMEPGAIAKIQASGSLTQGDTHTPASDIVWNATVRLSTNPPTSEPVNSLFAAGMNGSNPAELQGTAEVQIPDSGEVTAVLTATKCEASIHGWGPCAAPKVSDAVLSVTTK